MLAIHVSLLPTKRDQLEPRFAKLHLVGLNHMSPIHQMAVQNMLPQDLRAPWTSLQLRLI